MVINQTFLLSIYLVTTLVTVALVPTVLSNWKKPGATGMAIICAGIVIWGVAISLHTIASTDGLAFALINIVRFGASIAAIGWTIIIVDYTGFVHPLSRSVLILGAESLGFQALAWTNPWHGLVYASGVEFTSYESIIQHLNIGFWIHAIIVYIIIIAGILLVFNDALTTTGPRHTQDLALFGSVVPPFVLNIAHFTVQQTPFDPTPIGFSITVVVLSWALFRADFLSVVPIARQQAMESMDDPVIVLDDYNRVVDSNQAAIELVGDEQAQTGVEVTDFFESYPDVATELEKPNPGEKIQITDEGRSRYFDLNVSDVQGPQDRRRGRLVVFREISLLIEREEDLDRLAQVQSRVLRHNVRNALTVIKGCTEMFVDELNKEQAELAQAVISKTDDLVDITYKSHDAEKLVKRDQSTTTLELVDLIETVVTDYHHQYPAVSFSVTLPATCHIQTIPSMEIAIENLVENAGEHNDAADPQVMIEVTERDNSSMLEICDNASGISDTELASFDELHETPLQHGSGLGLWLVAWVIDASNATIEFETGTSGTTVTLEIPTE